MAGRLAEVPAVLADARGRLGWMPKVHVETAIGQFSGTIRLVTGEIDAALKAEPGCAGQIETVRPAALRALAGHRAWLSAKLEQPGRNSPIRGSARSGSPASCRSPWTRRPTPTRSWPGRRPILTG